MARAPSVASRSSALGGSNPPANTESRRIQNIAPEEMWNRVTQCVFPKYPAPALDSHITGTVDIGLGVSPEGDVGNNSRVLDGPPLFVQSAMDAIRRWKFRPNMVQGEMTWSRVRVLVHFNTDGTTAVDLAPAILADNFGDPGTPKATAAAVPRPASSPECKLMNDPAQGPIFVNGAYKVGIGGIGFPGCIACPDPSYSDQARSAKVSGIVVLHLVVTAEGHTANIQVQRSLGYGLDEEAVKTVEKWRFRPAVGLDGKPCPFGPTSRSILELNSRCAKQELRGTLHSSEGEHSSAGVDKSPRGWSPGKGHDKAENQRQENQHCAAQNDNLAQQVSAGRWHRDFLNRNTMKPRTTLQ